MRASLAFTLASSLAAVALAAVLVAKGMPTLGASVEAAMAATPVTDAAAPTTDAGATPLDAAPVTSADAAAPLAALDTTALEHLAEPPPPPEGDFHLADGTPVPPLDKGAPREVRFGVVLVTYEGAEGAPDKGARRKSDALALATKLADQAKSDFHGAVERGDTGSSDDVGEVTRGVLEPAPEAVLFALPAGRVSGVVDTPRGFWIVKRLE